MPTAAPNDAQLAGGRLFFGVTDILIGAPYGGTELGLASTVFVIPPQGVVHLPIEEDGSTGRTIYIGGDAVAGARMVTVLDADMVAALFPGAALGTGATTGPIINFPSKVGQTGEVLTNLLFAPVNSDHNAWVMPVAQPAIEEQALLFYSHRRWLAYPMLFRSQGDASGIALVTGKLSDLEKTVNP